jgi:hypothetical protein
LFGLANLSNANLSKAVLFVAVPVGSVGDPASSQVNRNLLKVLPFENPGGVSSYSTTVKNWYGADDLVAIIAPGPGFRIRDPVPPAYWPSLVMIFNYLASARNLTTARLPPGFSEFLSGHENFFSRGLQRPTCGNSATRTFVGKVLPNQTGLRLAGLIVGSLVLALAAYFVLRAWRPR